MKKVVIFYRDNPTVSNVPSSSVPHHQPHHFPYYTTLGTISSHVQPHFVVYDAGQKIQNMDEATMRELSLSIKDMEMFGGNELTAHHNLRLCQLAYRNWTSVSVPESFAHGRVRPPRTHSDGCSNRYPAPNNINDAGYSDYGSRPGTPVATNHHSPAQTPDLQHDLETCSSPVDDESARDAETREREPEFGWDIQKWATHSVTAVGNSTGWEPEILNDKQIGRYASSDIPYVVF